MSRLYRREFLVAASAAVGATILTPGRTRATESSPFRLNYILASPMYGTTALAEVLPEVARTGAAAIDIWPRRHANHREQVEEMGHERFRQLLRDHGVELGIVTRFDLGPYKLQDEMRVVSQLGGRMIVTGAPRASGGPVKQQVRAFVESLQPHIEQAAELGLVIAIENHANSLIDTPDSLRYFAEAATPPLGIALAPYHLPQEEALLAALIEQLGPRLALFYAWQHGNGCMAEQPQELELRQLPGRGPLDFTPLLAALRKTRYTGWTEIFMHPYPRGIPILDTTQAVTDAINTSRRYLESCLAPREE